MNRSSVALSNLRAVAILIVLSFHSVLAYLASLPAKPPVFNEAPYRWQAIPIVDGQRWFPFDLFCAWHDVSLMALMFFLSGLFVPASLNRKGALTFLWERFFRIGLPLMLVVVLLMPLTYYPVYLVTATDPSIGEYWQQWNALPFWPCGPQWFLWQLIALNVLAAALHRFAPGFMDGLARLAGKHRDPLRFFVVLVALSALAYVPLALAFSPWRWESYGPFSIQLCRPLLYLVYFLSGCAVGAHGLDRGLLSCDGPLARRWTHWLLASWAGFVLWALPTSLTVDGQEAPLLVQLAAALGFTIACASGCFALLALCLRFAQQRTRILDSLSANAYGMYLLHYVFVVWLQFALLPVALFAGLKWALVFAGTLALSWSAAVVLGNVAWDDYLAQAKRWLRATCGESGPASLAKQDDLPR